LKVNRLLYTFKTWG